MGERRSDKKEWTGVIRVGTLKKRLFTDTDNDDVITINTQSKISDVLFVCGAVDDRFSR